MATFLTEPQFRAKDSGNADFDRVRKSIGKQALNSSHTKKTGYKSGDFIGRNIAVFKKVDSLIV